MVTAPTNGAAGVVPAVMRYWLHFHAEADQQSIRDFLLTDAIGVIIKTASAGAEVGCKARSVPRPRWPPPACRGARRLAGAGGERCGDRAGAPSRHDHDPVRGSFRCPASSATRWAVKAVTAASLAIKGDGTHFVPLDAAIGPCARPAWT